MELMTKQTSYYDGYEFCLDLLTRKVINRFLGVGLDIA